MRFQAGKNEHIASGFSSTDDFALFELDRSEILVEKPNWDRGRETGVVLMPASVIGGIFIAMKKPIQFASSK